MYYNHKILLLSTKLIMQKYLVPLFCCLLEVVLFIMSVVLYKLTFKFMNKFMNKEGHFIPFFALILMFSFFSDK